jgi:hypothetical protein
MALLTNTVPTWAGRVRSPAVTIQKSPTLISVSGTMAGARYSTDNKQFIGCRLNAYSPPSLTALCSAKDSAGDSAHCTTNDPTKIERLQRMIDSSNIVFNANTTTGACDYLDIRNYSDQIK